MKRVVSISLGSSKRDHTGEMTLLGEQVRVERVGTDGDMQKAIALIRELDGSVDAFGMGGIDLYIRAGERRYAFRDARRIAAAAKLSPIVDGSGLKDTLERQVVQLLVSDGSLSPVGKRVLMVASVDRFGMAEALVNAGCDMVFGDMIFALGIPVPLHSLQMMNRVARLLCPVVTQLPFSMLYPTGSRQDAVHPKHERYFHWADWIAGDFHFIRRYMPEDLGGKTILTNTVTEADVRELKRRGVARLIATTPNIGGRSFGTNVIEAAIVAVVGNGRKELTSSEYLDVITRCGFRPRVEELNPPSMIGPSPLQSSASVGVPH